ncbi:SDR family oxidoreductase [Bacillus sp. FJAT-49711]|uniref:SDR family oxidoreductase n=1 Tax=Bacillus sp. FJAT-49711 TaxID=2833585 RepID=UPI001BC8E101|nr:SDR family oxidoreductase [Bacillus sp. FJAT-49711]MBS4218354.1 SDR family oxidoreductase [Bacillus sp. FJAT-49711]
MNILISGANRGLGFSLTKVGLERGHYIFAGVRNISDSLLNLQEVYTDQLEILKIDVTDEETVVEAANSIKKNHLKIDSIINSAGVLLGREKYIEELNLDEMMKSYDINTLGPIRIIKNFLPLLMRGDKQTIINITSEAGSITNAYSRDYPYGLSKVALNMLSEKLNVYLKEKDIKVYSIHPGWMKTDMGGENAPTDPMETANGIMDIIERKVEVKSKYVFIDYNGQPMVI